VVGERAALVDARKFGTRLVEERGQLVDAECREVEKLGQVVPHHRRARSGRGHDRKLGVEGPCERATDASRGRVMAGVVGGLAAADLPAWELDVVAGSTEERRRVLDGVGEDEVAEARGEELYALHRPPPYSAAVRGEARAG
jgi:hypothetical protein